MKLSSILVAAAFVAVAATLSHQPLRAQQKGGISGRVVDARNGEPMTKATVRIVNTTRGAFTNTSGDYSIDNLEPGTYSVRISYAGYGEMIFEGVVVEAGRFTRRDATLDIKARKEIVTVTAQRSRESAGAALTERRRGSTVQDMISSQEIARAAASDAGDAMKRVTGVSVVGSRYVVVRGLTERYSATQLNGVNLPSPEPEKKVVPFDIFPSSMVSRISTVKTFTPDNPGDFAGGLVRISTRDYPESFLLTASAGVGVNTATQGNDGLEDPIAPLGFLGQDDGARALPDNLPIGRRQTIEEQAALMESFGPTTWSPAAVSPAPNSSYSLSVGDKYDVGFPVGFLLSGSYSRGTSYRVEETSYPLLSVTEGRHDLRYDYDAERTETSTLWGGLLNLSAEPSAEHKVALRTIYNFSSEAEARRVTGLYNQSTTGDLRYTRLRLLERSLFSANLSGEHAFEDLNGAKLEWRGAHSIASRNEPDNRSVTYLRGVGETDYRFVNNFGSNNGRFFSELDDTESSVGADVLLPMDVLGDGATRLKVGGLGRFRSRDFSARRFLLTTQTSDDAFVTLAPDQLFTAAHIREGKLVFNDETQSTDRYDASETISAAYAMVDLPITEKLRAIAGARFEDWSVDLDAVNPLTELSDSSLAVRRAQTDILPSFNLIYALDEEMNVRASYTRTLARPEFRELAPFRFDDYRQSTYGNPSLERTLITNYDLRWEWITGGGEVLAVSGFYKEFENPIEQFYLIGGSGISVEPVNAKEATTMGAEFELRKGLGFLTEDLAGFSIGANLTLVQSEVAFDAGEFVTIFDGVGLTAASSATLTNATRPLQGQSPYVVNLSLGYDNADWGTSATLLYNAFGERLSIVGTEGIPDTYEQPRPTLDLNISQRLPAGLQLKLSAKNLLDSETLLQQEFDGGEQIAIERYTTGRTVSLGISFSLDQLQIQSASSAP